METISMGTHENGGQESEAQPVEPKFWYFKESHLIFEKAEMEAYAKITGYEPIPLYLAPPSAKAIETAALMKAAGECREAFTEDTPSRPCLHYGNGWNDAAFRHRKAIIALITPEGKTALEEFGMRVACGVASKLDYFGTENTLRVIVKQVMEGEKE